MANYFVTTLWALFISLSLCTVLVDVGAVKRFNIYDKRYIEDSCTGEEKIIYELNASGLSSVLKIGATRHTWFSSNRNCIVTIRPPYGHGVVFRIESMYFGSSIGSNCVDYLQVFENEGNSTKLCGFLEPRGNELTFASKGGMRLLYHTSCYEDTYRGTGFTVVVTAYSETLTTCGEGQYQCSNSRCICEEIVCDGIDNCGDESDEKLYGRSNCQEIPDFTVKPINVKWELAYPTSKERVPYTTTTAPVGATITCITILLIVGMLRVFCFYNCPRANRRNLLTGMAVIRTTHTDRRATFNLHGLPPPLPYRSLITDVTDHSAVSYLSSPPYLVNCTAAEWTNNLKEVTQNSNTERPSKRTESTVEEPPSYEQ